MRITRTLATTSTAVLLAVTMTGCGDSGTEANVDSGGTAESDEIGEAADTPHETMRRWIAAYQSGDLEAACNLWSINGEPIATYPGLMSECLDDAADKMDGDSSEDWEDEVFQQMADTPEDRISVEANGAGDPQLRYNDESAETFAYAEFDEVNGLFYVSQVNTYCC